MATNINRVILEGELLADPVEVENRTRMQLLVLGLTKIDEETWAGRPNHFDIVVWGELGKRCLAELRTGAAVAIEGRLEWVRGTETQEGRIPSRVEVVADEVRFLTERATQPVVVEAPPAEPATEQAEAAAA